MILINLLPAEFAPKKIKKKVNVPYRPILLGVFVLFVVFALFNLYYSINIQREKRVLNKKWETMATPNAEAERLNGELGTTVTAEIDFYDTFTDAPLEVAHVMNDISDTIPKGVWLSSLRFERKLKEVQINMIGFAEAPKGDSRLVDIQNFVNHIKEEAEKLLNPGPALPLVPRKVLTVAVTTTSRQEEKGSNVVEFKALLQTEGFAAIP